jgi:hypothetical protein
VALCLPGASEREAGTRVLVVVSFSTIASGPKVAGSRASEKVTEMGVTRFKEISQYALYTDGNTTDVLKIYYKRAKGSFLPHSRKYRFGRSIKMMLTESDRGVRQEMHVISPFLQRALGELDLLSASKQSAMDEKARLLSDIDRLERVVVDTIGDMRSRIDKLGNV